MKRLFTCLFLVPSLILFAACAGTTVTLEGLEKDCQTDTDCVAVFIGDFCENPNCSCPNDAINVASKPSYTAEIEGMSSRCLKLGFHPNCDCPGATPTCVNNICVVR